MDNIAGFLVLMAMAAMGGLAWWNHRLGVRRQHHLLERLAHQRNGVVRYAPFTTPTVCLSYPPYQLTVSPTRISVPLSLSRHLVLVCYRGDASPYPGMRLTRVQVGHPRFEQAFLIEGDDHYVVRAVLSPEIQTHLLTGLAACGDEYSLLITHQHLEARMSSSPETNAHYEQVITAIRACLERLRACTLIRRVIVGHLLSYEVVPTEMVWPSLMADSSCPLLALHDIMIHTTTARDHDLDHLLTYVVNALGQRYLKQSVTVHLYGDVQHISANVHNALMNVCHNVCLHYEDEWGEFPK